MAHMQVKPDPAYLKLAAMKKVRHQYFRWTPRTARIAFTYIVAVPTLMGYIAYEGSNKWDFRAKRRGDLVYEN